MDALSPAVAQFLVQAPSCELQPPLIEEIAQLVRSGHPDEHRRGIGHNSKPGLAFSKQLFSLLTLGNISPDRDILNGVTLLVEKGHDCRRDPVERSVFGSIPYLAMPDPALLDGRPQLAEELLGMVPGVY